MSKENAQEDYYDNEIAPALLAIARTCIAKNMHMVALIEYQPGEYGQTVALQTDASFGTRLVELAIRANGNVDALLIALMTHARKHGHTSVILAQLGVPTAPQGALQ